MTPTNPPSSSPSKAGRLAWGLGAALACGMALAAGPCPGEQERAAATRQRILREWPLRSSGDEAVEFVQELALRLAGHYGRGADKIPWRFALLRNLAPNAFSIGAGYVFVTEGAVTFAQNEEEMAAIIAHELGHELAGHFCDKTRPGGFFDIFAGPQAALPQDGAGLGSLRQTVDPAEEQQADRIALAILRAAAYDPHAMLRVAMRLRSAGDGHLFDPGRVQSLQQLLAGSAASSGPKDSDRFQQVRRSLAGEAPAGSRRADSP